MSAKLIIIRHGQSVWNLENRFTGWIDVVLSEKGVEEAKLAGDTLKDYKFDVAFTSNLIRANQTLFEILKLNKHNQKYRKIHDEKKSEWYSKFTEVESDNQYLNVYFSEKLNERYYGDLQGLNKEETKQKYGEEQLKLWRRSFDIAPPNGESLKDNSKRTLPYFKKNILPYLKDGKTVLIVAHGNSLRSIIKYIEKLTPEKIVEYELETGVPIEYSLSPKMKILMRKVLK